MLTGEIAIVLAKGLVGGVFVALFALVGESVQPKSFSGLFSAAPSIALGALAITLLTDGSSDAKDQALAMVFGALAMVLFCMVAAVSDRAVRCGVRLGDLIHRVVRGGRRVIRAGAAVRRR